MKLKPLVFLAVFLLLVNAFLLFNSSGSKVASSSENTRFIMSEGKSVYLGVKDHKSEEDRQIAIQASPDEVVEIQVRKAVAGESESTYKLNEFLEQIIGHNNKGQQKSSAQFKSLYPESHSRFNFHFQSFDEPGLLFLRKREKLDEVIAKGKSELEKIVLLQNWVRQQWQVGTPNPYPQWDANQILSMIRSGQTGGFCGQYSQVLVQALQSLGYKARYIGLKNHFALEVFWNEGGKWLSLDPFYNALFKKGETYLSTYEVYQGLHNKEEISVLNTSLGSLVRGPEKSKILQHYSEMTFDLKADHLGARESGLYFVENSWQTSVFILDEFSKNRTFNGKNPAITDRVRDLYFLIDDVKLKALKFDEQSLVLELISDSHLSSYQMSINNSPFKDVPKRVSLPVNGKMDIRVRAKNRAGIWGPIRQYSFTP